MTVLPEAGITPIDLAEFDLGSMIECGRALRRIAGEASSMEEAARKIVRLFQSQFADAQTGKSDCALVRCFKTHRFGALPPALSAAARKLLVNRESAHAELPCLTLLATAGDLPAWNDRRQSLGHAVIPLESVEIVERAPMIASLFRQMGLAIEAVMYPDPQLILDSEQHAFNVFHVEQAVDSLLIPAQKEFVRPYGIRSVLGFGGILPSGDLFAIIMFSRITVPRETADMFRTIALAVKLALLPFTRGPIFASAENDIPTAPAVNSPSESGDTTTGETPSETSTSGLLIHALEEAALQQTQRLSASYLALQRDERIRRESEQRLRLALDAGNLGTWAWDRNSDLITVDRRTADIFHWKQLTPVSRTAFLEETVFSEDRAAALHALTKAARDKGYYDHDYRIVRPDGKLSWVHSCGVTVSDDQVTNGVSGMIGTVQDTTERKNQEAALKQTEMLAATGKMAATIAHEINNPLEAVTNLIFLAKTNQDIPETVRRHLEVADEELARVGQIAQQTLGFYRDASRPALVDFRGLITDIVNLYQRRLAYKRIKCIPEFRGNLEIFGLQGELRQAISNLVVNAIDASHNGGTIRIQAREVSVIVTGVPALSITVSDIGTGISETAKKRLFSPFFTTKESVGTGLGLWITKGIVEKHGGNIRFRSRTQNPSGTIFRLLLKKDNPGLARTPTIQ